MKSAAAPPQKKTKNSGGFTLVELLIVIGVIGVLAAGLLILINPLGQLQKARDAQRKQNISQIATALETYMAVNGTYPFWTANGDNSDPSDYSTFNSWTGITNPPETNTLAYNLTPNSIKKLPIDPKNTCPVWGETDCHVYIYTPLDNGKCFQLYANLENNSDPQRSGPYHGNLDYSFNCNGILQ